MLGVLVLAVGALAIISAPIASLTPVMAQQTTTTNATSPEGGMAAMTEEHEYASNETSTGGTATVRDSVFALLQTKQFQLVDSFISIIPPHLTSKVDM